VFVPYDDVTLLKQQILLGDIADMLPFRGLSVSLSVWLSVMFMHCAQTAEDINVISFVHDSPISLPDCFEVWLTSINVRLPKFERW